MFRLIIQALFIFTSVTSIAAICPTPVEMYRLKTNLHPFGILRTLVSSAADTMLCEALNRNLLNDCTGDNNDGNELSRLSLTNTLMSNYCLITDNDEKVDMKYADKDESGKLPGVKNELEPTELESIMALKATILITKALVHLLRKHDAHWANKAFGYAYAVTNADGRRVLVVVAAFQMVGKLLAETLAIMKDKMLILIKVVNEFAIKGFKGGTDRLYNRFVDELTRSNAADRNNLANAGTVLPVSTSSPEANTDTSKPTSSGVIGGMVSGLAETQTGPANSCENATSTGDVGSPEE